MQTTPVEPPQSSLAARQEGPGHTDRRIAAIIAAATTSALAAGFFYAYTASVSRGLGRLADAQYVAAMQSINDTVRNPIFAVSFFGALVALPLAMAA